MEASEPNKLQKRRWNWRQYRISTLLIFVTIVSVGLALVTNPAERQRRAVVAIRELGGTVWYDFEKDGIPGNRPRPHWLCRILGVDYSADVVHVRLIDRQVTNAGLAHLAGLSNLQELQLGNSLQVVPLIDARVTDAGLAHLAGLTNLQKLQLGSTEVTDVGLAHLVRLTSLQSLWLNDTQVTDAGVPHLAELKSLEWLWLDRTRVTDKGCDVLRQALPNCSIPRPGRGPPRRFQPLPGRQLLVD